MKKNVLYVIIGVTVLAVLAIIIVNSRRQHSFDDRITFNRKDKIPYGLYTAYNLLGAMFNGSETNISRVSPENWEDKYYVDSGHTLMFLVTRQFNPSVIELNYLNDFVKAGNNVFISTPYMSKEAKKYFKLDEEYSSPYSSMGVDYMYDSGKSSLLHPPFPGQNTFFNPGFSYAVSFTDYDSAYYEVLGKDRSNKVNFLRLRAGSGSFFFNSNPFLFANYFLLHQNNISYFESFLSLVPGATKKIIWDEYFVYKLPDDQDVDEPSPLRVLLKYPAFKWAMLLAVCLLALYVILNLKRVQRIIPVLSRPKNDSLDFIKTIGKLYYEKGDHANLAKKMSAYFLDFVRQQYFVQTGDLDEEFIKNLSGKSGFPEDKTRMLVDQVLHAQKAETMSEQQLVELYTSISSFYKK